MCEISRFQNLCRRVRFCLDEASSDLGEANSFLADFVARVRSTGLQVTRATVPEVYRAVSRVKEALGVPVEPEVYVVNDVSANAFAPAFASGNRPILVLNSGLVTLLNSNELAFAIAHELGHLGLRHSQRLPSVQPQSEFEALQKRSLQRYAEISADRIALIATRSVFGAAHVMVKLASVPSRRYLP